MKPKDFLLLMAICLVWAGNLIVSKIVLSDMAVPPFFYAAIRFLVVAVVLAPMLRPFPRQFGWVVLVGLLMGAGHFGILFYGLATSSPSSASIVLQFGIPFTAILSVIILGERITPQRLAGIVISVAGVIMVIWDPRGFHASVGLIFVLISALSLSLGGVLLKTLFGIRPLNLQSWVALVSCVPLGLASLVLEHDQAVTSLRGGWMLLGAILFSAFVVTAWSHTKYFGLLQRYEANFIAPITLAMPLMAMAMGVLFLGDHIDARIVAGTVVAISGILLVLLGRRKPLPAAVLAEG